CSRSGKKQKSSGGKSQILVAKTDIENADSIVRKPAPLGSVRIPPLLLYLGGEGGADRPAREGDADRPAVLCNDVGISFWAGTRADGGRRKKFRRKFREKTLETFDVGSRALPPHSSKAGLSRKRGVSVKL